MLLARQRITVCESAYTDGVMSAATNVKRTSQPDSNLCVPGAINFLLLSFGFQFTLGFFFSVSSNTVTLQPMGTSLSNGSKMLNL